MQRRGFLGASLAWLLACRRGPTEVAGGRKFYSSGPYVGVRDGTDPNPNYASSISNGVIRATREGVRARPGVVALVDIGATPVQGAISFRLSTGTAYTFIVVNGLVYRLNDDNTVTDVTPGGATISTTARVYMEMLADKMFVSDGVNPMWVGTTLSATPITAAKLDIDGTGTSKVYGKPVVYYAKLFVINAKSRNQILWSEENDGTIGYNGLGSPTYLDVWTLAQNDTDPLHALYGSNDALYYWRENSLGKILGAVGPDFTTTGVHDAISSSIGTISPGAVCAGADVIFFLDQNGLPQSIRLGQGLTDPPPWQDCAQTLKTVDTSLLTLYAHAAYNTDLNRVVLLHPIASSTTVTVMLFDSAHNLFHGTWAESRIGAARTVFMRQDVVDGTTGDAMTFVDSTAPHAFVSRLYRWAEAVWGDKDTPGSSFVFPNTVVYGPALANDATTEKYFDQESVIMKTDVDGTLTPYIFAYRTPRGSSSGVTVNTNPRSGGDYEVMAGINAFGRWCKPGIVYTNSANNPAQIMSQGVYGQPEDMSPTMP